MCDIEIPRECGNSKWTAEESPRIAATAKMAAPNFNTIKNNVDNLNAKLDKIKNDPKFKQTPPPVAMMREYQQLLKKRNNFVEDLRDHPNFQTFEQGVAARQKEAKDNLQSIQKLSDEERENFLKKWKKMASPKKSQLIAALSSINHALATIVNDRYWCKNSYRKRRYKELILYRNQICKKLLKYSPERSESFECFQFKPCKLIIAKIWKYSKKNKRGNIARFLKFDFDEHLNRLGMPKKCLIENSIRTYENFMAQLYFQMKEDLIETVDEKLARIEKLTEEFENCQKRRNFLIEIKNKIIEKENARKTTKVDENANKPQEKENTKEFPPAGYWQGSIEKNFQNHIELPPRHKLEAVLRHQEKMLAEIERIDGIKAGPKGETNKVEKSKKEQSEATSSGAQGMNKSRTGEPNKNQIKQKSQEPQAQKVSKQKVGNLMMMGDSSEEIVPPKNQKEDKKASKGGGNRMIPGGSDESFLAYQKGDKEKSSKKEAEKDEIDAFSQDDSKDENEASEAPAATTRNPIAIRKLKEGLISNIEYIKNCLANYPETIKLHICKPDPMPKEVKRKQFNIKNEAKDIETFSMPKYNILLASREKYDEMLKKFEIDVGNKEAIEAFDMTNEGEDEKEEDEGFINDENKNSQRYSVHDPKNAKAGKEPIAKLRTTQDVKTLPAAKCVDKKKEKDLESRVEVYRRLKKGKEKVEELIRKQEERLEKMNSQNTSGPSLHSHNKVCNKVEEEVKPRKEYKLTRPRKDIFIATEARLRYALDKHLEWIEERLKRVGSQREAIKRMLKNLESGRSALDDGNESLMVNENVQETSASQQKVKFNENLQGTSSKNDEKIEDEIIENKPKKSGFLSRKSRKSSRIEKETLMHIKVNQSKSSRESSVDSRKSAQNSKSRKSRKASKSAERIENLAIEDQEASEPLQEEINQQQQSQSPKFKEETLKAISPYLARFLRHKFILENYLQQIEEENEKHPSLHTQSHKNADDHFHPPEKTYFDFSKKGTADLKYHEALARPKQVCLQSTLDKFSNLMCVDKQERIKCQLNIQRRILRPEDLEDIVRGVQKPKPKIQNRTAKMKCELSKQIYDQVAKILKKKTAREMARAMKKPKAISQPFREVEKTIFMLLMSINGIPRSHQECEMYNNFTSVIMEFLMKALQKKLN